MKTNPIRSLKWRRVVTDYWLLNLFKRIRRYWTSEYRDIRGWSSCDLDDGIPLLTRREKLNFSSPFRTAVRPRLHFRENLWSTTNRIR